MQKKNRFELDANISPQVVRAGDSEEFTMTLTCAEEFDVHGSCLRFDFPATLGYSRPSIYDQEDDGYIEVFVSNPAIGYTKRIYDMEAQRFLQKEDIGVENNGLSFKGMAQRVFVLELTVGTLRAGDEITVIWGYTRNGFGCGTKVTTVIPYTPYYNQIDIDFFADATRCTPHYGRDFVGAGQQIADQSLQVAYEITTREPRSIRSIRGVEKTTLLFLDKFGNSCAVDQIEDYIECPEGGAFNDAGVYEIAGVEGNIVSKGLPLTITPRMDTAFGNKHIYFGDLHTHSSLSNDTIEREKMTMTPQKSFDFGRHVAALDFMAITDHHQMWDIERNKIGENNWKKLVTAVDNCRKEGKFIAYAGFEHRDERGDTTVFFDAAPTYAEINKSEISNIKKLWNHLTHHANYITMFHFHNPGTLANDQWYSCPYDGVEPLMEIYSCHGSYEQQGALERGIPLIKSFRPDRCGHYFLQQGFRYGITCNSDGHKGNPGFNGLTAVYVESLDSHSIMEAIKQRHVYGTTNARIRLLCTIDDNLMGSILPAQGQMTMAIEIEGEGSLKCVEIFRNGHSWKKYEVSGVSYSDHITFAGKPGDNWYVKVTQKDNHMAYSSPIWLE